MNCDEQRIMQVLLGLQSNALKFTCEGKVKICVKFIERDQEDQANKIEISVADTGIGISEAD